MDGDDDLRPALLTRGRLITIGSVAAGVVLVFFVLPRFLRWREDRERAAREAAEAPYRAEQVTLEKQLVERFAPLVTVPAAAPETCPPEVTGPLPLVQRERLATAVTPNAGYFDGALLSSPAFLWWTGAWTPSFGDTAQLARRNQAYRELLAAKHIAIFSTAEAKAIKTTGEATFEGGDVAGDLAIVDVATHAAVCRTVIRVQPSFVVAVKQDSVEGDKWAMAGAQRDAIADAFWTGVQAQLARMAPGAHVVTK